jgi:hypothetical protein
MLFVLPIPVIFVSSLVPQPARTDLQFVGYVLRPADRYISL